MFYVGQEVVCVNDTVGAFDVPGWKFDHSGHWPLVKGKKFTISEILKSRTGQICLKFVGIPPRSSKDDGYNQKRFRPIVKQHKGMETLTSILNNPKQKIESDQFDKIKV